MMLDGWSRDDYEENENDKGEEEEWKRNRELYKYFRGDSFTDYEMKHWHLPLPSVSLSESEWQRIWMEEKDGK